MVIHPATLMNRIVSAHAAELASKLVLEHSLNERLLIQYDVHAPNFGNVILNEMSRLSTEEIKLIQNLSHTPSVVQTILDDSNAAPPEQDGRIGINTLPMALLPEEDAPPRESRRARSPFARNGPMGRLMESIDLSVTENKLEHMRDDIDAEEADEVDQEIEALLGPAPATPHAQRPDDSDGDADLDREVGLAELGVASPTNRDTDAPHRDNDAPHRDTDESNDDRLISDVAERHAQQLEQEVVDGVRKQKAVDATVHHTLRDIHDYEQMHTSPLPRRKILRGGEQQLLEVLSAYLDALRELWALFTVERVDRFRAQMYDAESGVCLYPVTASLLAQASMVDHDLVQTHRDRPIAPLDEDSDFMERKKLLTLVRRAKGEYIHRSALHDDFCGVALPAVKLYLRGRNELINTAFRWVQTSRKDRLKAMAELVHKADVADLRSRFVMDKNMFNRPKARKHVNDYYRMVLEHRLGEMAFGDPAYRGMAADSYVDKPTFDSVSIVAALTDMDPQSERMGFLLPEPCQMISRSRNRQTIEKLIALGEQRLQDPVVQTMSVVYNSRIAQRRLYLLKRLGPELMQTLSNMPSGILKNIGV